MSPVVNTNSLSIKFSQSSCVHNISDSSGSDNAFRNISTISATLLHQLTSIGLIKANLFNKAAMKAIGLAEMWQQCQAYDATHAPEAKLDKVDNFLANESFPPERQAQIDEADWVLYLEEAYIVPTYRRRGLSLLTIDLLIKELGVGNRCVVLLQAGSIVRYEKGERAGCSDATEACERITAHWKRMGFYEWSDSDDAWLCLLTGERPKIEDVVTGLFHVAERREDPEVLHQ